MNENLEKQKEYFSAITKDREDNAKIIEKSSMRGVKDTVVDKYSDQAHFIYELLQNADDAKAKKARFHLSDEGLTFIHNGTVQFTASNPDSLSEENDRIRKNLGHINAITSIGQSAKDKATIGKFGVGFKAIFQYTNTPHIYDDNFWFKIERLIVPKQLANDHKERKKNQTLFYFPFDKETKSKEEAFDDILHKLKSLIHPVLFLNNLDEIIWETDKERGNYLKKIKEERSDKGILSQLLSLVENKENTRKEKKLWLFTRTISTNDSTYKYSVGFFLDKQLKLDTTVNYTAFCFFPTKETTNLKFIIQAPFLLTDSREGIKAGVEWNKDLIEKLALLAADCMLVLKSIGTESNNQLIDDNFIYTIPHKEFDFTIVDDRNKISFLPFYTAIKSKLQIEKLLPGKNGTFSSKNLSYWASDTELTEMFDDKQIADLMDKKGAKWVFPTIGWKDLSNTNKDLVKYIDGGNEITKVPSNLIITNIDPIKILRRINATFIEQQSMKWLRSFYSYLLDRRGLWDTLRTKPIFINSEGKAVAAFDISGKNLAIFLPSETQTTYQTINNSFLSDEKSIQFFSAFGITHPELKDEIYHNILPLYNEDFDYTDIETNKLHFETFLKYYQECQNIHLQEYLDKLIQIEFLFCRTKEQEYRIVHQPGYCYYPNEELINYFENIPDTPFIDLEFYLEIVGIEKKELLDKFLSAWKVILLPKVNQTQ